MEKRNQESDNKKKAITAAAKISAGDDEDVQVTPEEWMEETDRCYCPGCGDFEKIWWINTCDKCEKTGGRCCLETETCDKCDKSYCNDCMLCIFCECCSRNFCEDCARGWGECDICDFRRSCWTCAE